MPSRLPAAVGCSAFLSSLLRSVRPVYMWPFLCFQAPLARCLWPVAKERRPRLWRMWFPCKQGWLLLDQRAELGHLLLSSAYSPPQSPYPNAAALFPCKTPVHSHVMAVGVTFLLAALRSGSTAWWNFAAVMELGIFFLRCRRG